MGYGLDFFYLVDCDFFSVFLNFFQDYQDLGGSEKKNYGVSKLFLNKNSLKNKTFDPKNMYDYLYSAWILGDKQYILHIFFQKKLERPTHTSFAF